MYIEQIKIDRFAGLAAREYTFGRGVNIIEGDNESGKSTVAAFLRFMFYGFQSRSGERERYLSLTHGCAAGSLRFQTESGSYRIDRSVYPASDQRAGQSGIYRENLAVIDLATNTPLRNITQPGEHFFGVSAEVFSSSAFVGQLGQGKLSGASLRQAIENILFSADADLSTQKALKKLDEQRVYYLHKNKKGGKLYTLQCRLDEGTARLQSAKALEEKLTGLEQEIARLEKKREENKAKAEECRRLIALSEEYQSLQQSMDISRLRTLQAQEDEKAQTIERRLFRGGFIPDSAYVARLRELAGAMGFARRAKEEAEKQLRETDFSAQSETPHEPQLQRMEQWGGADCIRAAVLSHAARRRTFTLLAVVFLMLAVFSTALTAFLYVFSSPYRQHFVLASALIAALTLFFFSGRVKHDRVIRSILSGLGCETEEELDDLLEEHSVTEAKRHVHSDNRRALTERISAETEKLLSSTTEAASLLDQLQSTDTPPISPKLLTKEQIETIADQLESALSCAARARAEAEKYRAMAEKSRESGESPEQLHRRLDTLRQSFGEHDPDTVDTANLRREIDFCHKANESLGERILSLKTSYAESNASFEDPQVLEEMLADLRRQMKADGQKYAAIELAMTKLTQASEQLRGMIAPSLSEATAKIVARLTDGRYQKIGLDNALAMSYETAEHRIYDALYFSGGTKDIAYIALRLALVDTLYQKDRPPVIFDESFAQLDDERFERMLNLLFAMGQQGRQSFVFTCHRRERESAEQMGLCAVLHLEPKP